MTFLALLFSAGMRSAPASSASRPAFGVLAALVFVTGADRESTPAFV